jgi:hypothetical protein
MRRRTVYLEASGRTQDLLNIKWALLASGYSIGSTWHENQPGISGAKKHWDRDVEQLQVCDALIVICGTFDNSVSELAMMAGFALARGLQVIWIGPQLRGLSGLPAVKHFNSADDYRKQIVPHPVLEIAQRRSSHLQARQRNSLSIAECA